MAMGGGTESVLQRCVLIVDDDDDVREVAADVLRDAGYVVTTAPDMGTGLRAAAEVAPDVILLDLHMPDGGGEAFLRAYQQSACPPRTTVVAFTALLDGAERAAALGVKFVLPKPFHVPQLVREMERWAASSRSA